MSQFHSRRQLIKYVGQATLLGSAVVGFGKQLFAAAAKVYKKADLAETKKNPSLAAFKYVADATKSSDRKAAKMGVEADKQFCDNCNFYRNPGNLEGTKDEVGQCMLLQNQAVHAKGWCNMWAKKP